MFPGSYGNSNPNPHSSDPTIVHVVHESDILSWGTFYSGSHYVLDGAGEHRNNPVRRESYEICSFLGLELDFIYKLYWVPVDLALRWSAVYSHHVVRVSYHCGWLYLHPTLTSCFHVSRNVEIKQNKTKQCSSVAKTQWAGADVCMWQYGLFYSGLCTSQV